MTSTLRGVLAVVAGSILGIAMYPLPKPIAVALLISALGFATLATVGGDLKLTVSSERLYTLAIRAALAVGVVLFGTSLRSIVAPGTAIETVGWVGLTAVVGATAFAMLDDRYGSKAAIAFFGFYSLSLVWVLVATLQGDPFIDVIQFQQGASAALADGINPYAMRFPDLYGVNSALFYGVGVSVDGVLNFGFPYPPLSLLLVAPFEWVLSDLRVAHAVAIVGAAVLMSRASDSRRSRGSAAAFLLMAPVLFVLRFGWTEPLLVFAVVAVMYSATHAGRGTSYVVGFVVALKQYAILLLPASLLLLDRPWTARQIGAHLARAGAVVVITTVPFFLWDPEAFVRSVVELQFLQPFRPDSTAFPALWAEYFGAPNRMVIVVLPLVLVVVVTIVTWIRTPSGAQGFALASGLTLLVVLAFSKQAFANYYLVVIALFFGAAAVAGDEWSVDLPIDQGAVAEEAALNAD